MAISKIGFEAENKETNNLNEKQNLEPIVANRLLATHQYSHGLITFQQYEEILDSDLPK